MRFIRDRLRVTRSNNDILGLDIGCSSLQCVVLHSNGNTGPYELKNYGIKATPSGAIQNNCIKSESLLRTAIKQLLIDASINVRNCVIALPDALVSSKWIRMDYSATENIEIAINLAIEKHIPYPLDAIYFDYQIFNTQQKDTNHLNVLLVACHKTALEIRLDILRQLNLTPLFIEINSHAIERAYSFFYAACVLNPCIIVNIETKQLNFLHLNGSEKSHNYTENIDAADNQKVLQQIQRFIGRLRLSDPYLKQEKLFFIGANHALLNFLVKKMHDFLGLTPRILVLEDSPLIIRSLKEKEKEFKTLYPNLFLSIGLALRACLA